MTPAEHLEEARRIAAAVVPPSPPPKSLDERWAEDVLEERRLKRQQALEAARSKANAEVETEKARTELLGKHIPGLIERFAPYIVGGAPRRGTHNGIPDHVPPRAE